jgi:hypothetical protein
MAYSVYGGVKKLQGFLEDQLAKGVIVGPSLREDDGTFDGKYGPMTDGAFQAWLATQPAGTTVQALVDLGVLTEAEAAEVLKAQGEWAMMKVQEGGPKGGEAPPPTYTVPSKQKKEGWSATTWVLVGAAAAGAGLLAWYLLRRRSVATAGLNELSEGDVAGLGKIARKPLGCGCGK